LPQRRLIGGGNYTRILIKRDFCHPECFNCHPAKFLTIISEKKYALSQEFVQCLNPSLRAQRSNPVRGLLRNSALDCFAALAMTDSGPAQIFVIGLISYINQWTKFCWVTVVTA